MFKNYITVILRNLLKYKTISLITVSGLALGLAGCILIVLHVRNELNYDRFHAKADRIYRLNMRHFIGTNQFEAAIGPCPLAAAIRNDFPEVETSTRLLDSKYRGKSVHIHYQDRRFREERFVWADSNVFDVFSFTFIQGDSKTALMKPNTVVITPAIALKYFGNENPIGKTLMLENSLPLLVTGVVEEMPDNSHFHFDFLASFSTIKKSKDPEWYDTAVFTYIVLRENASPDGITAGMPAFCKKYMQDVIEQLSGGSYEQFVKSGNELGFFLQPLLNIHLDKAYENEFEPHGNPEMIVVLTAIALIILIVACINFVNLSIARSSQRTNEIGMRKVVGASTQQLAGQFFIESIAISFIALFIALGMIELFLPLFNDTFNKHISRLFFLDGMFLSVFLPGTLLIGILAGFYPAILLSSFKPVEALKGKIYNRPAWSAFRNGLVTFQFTASAILLITTMIIYRQLDYVQNKDLGFAKDQIVIIPDVYKLGKEQPTFKNRLLTNPDIISATYTDCLPFSEIEVKVFQAEGAAETEHNTLVTILSDYDFLQTYQVPMMDGRFLDKKYGTDSSAIILNETAVRELHLGNPIGKRLIFKGGQPKPYTIAGVFRDFHYLSMHVPIQPMAVMLIWGNQEDWLSVKIRPGRIRETLGFIESEWNQCAPDQPIDYTFFDDFFTRDYGTEIRTGKVVSAFAIFTILISCFGLYGLSSFTIARRTKEIGIRKVLGASVSGIIILLTKEFTRWVLLANLIAWPLAYFFTEQWLDQFAYRTDIEFTVFLLSAILTLLIAAGTIMIHTFRAATANPVHSLRYE